MGKREKRNGKEGKKGKGNKKVLGTDFLIYSLSNGQIISQTSTRF